LHANKNSNEKNKRRLKKIYALVWTT